MCSVLCDVYQNGLADIFRRCLVYFSVAISLMHVEDITELWNKILLYFVFDYILFIDPEI